MWSWENPVAEYSIRKQGEFRGNLEDFAKVCKRHNCAHFAHVDLPKDGSWYAIVAEDAEGVPCTVIKRRIGDDVLYKIVEKVMQ